METFGVAELNLYITNVESKKEALVIALSCGWGICEKHLIEVDKLPEDIKIYGIIDRPEFDPSVSYAVDPLA